MGLSSSHVGLGLLGPWPVNNRCLPVTLVPCLIQTLSRNRLRGEASAGGGAGERLAERQMETGRDGKQPHSHIQPWAPQGPQCSAIPKAPGLLLEPSSANAPRFPQETPVPALCLAWNSTERSGSRQLRRASIDSRAQCQVAPPPSPLTQDNTCTLELRHKQEADGLRDSCAWSTQSESAGGQTEFLSLDIPRPKAPCCKAVEPDRAQRHQVRQSLCQPNVPVTCI